MIVVVKLFSQFVKRGLAVDQFEQLPQFAGQIFGLPRSLAHALGGFGINGHFFIMPRIFVSRKPMLFAIFTR